jgi:predicted neutral ceramidase superfamily lipid hydrolase
LQLYNGQAADTNHHILNRAAVVLIATLTIMLFNNIKLENKVLTYLIPYSISMGIVFLYVWITGFFQPLHPDAYRDIFLNFTSVSALVMTVIYFKDRRLGSRGNRSSN